MFACTSLGEEGVEGVVRDTNRVVLRTHAVRMDTVLQAVQLPEIQIEVFPWIANYRSRQLLFG